MASCSAASLSRLSLHAIVVSSVSVMYSGSVAGKVCRSVLLAVCKLLVCVAYMAAAAFYGMVSLVGIVPAICCLTFLWVYPRLEVDMQKVILHSVWT